MIAATIAEQVGGGGAKKRDTGAGSNLVKMALAVDPVFASELARHCGPAVWNQVRASVGARLRAIYATPDGNWRQCALAAMLATGAADFRDIIAPLLSGQDQQVRLGTYRIWPDIQVSSLGPNWRDEVRGWSEEARVDFVAELLRDRPDGGIVSFAMEDTNAAVKEAAVSGLMWTGSEEALTRVLLSADEATFEDLARKNAHRMPVAFRVRTVAAIRKVVESTTDHPARLRTALTLIELGETGLDGIVKDAMAALPSVKMGNQEWRSVQQALEYLRKADPAWASEWVATQIAEGDLYGDDYWFAFATAVPNGLIEKYLQRLGTEDLKDGRFQGMAAVVARHADAKLAARVFGRLRELRRGIHGQPGQRSDSAWRVMRQLETVFRGLRDDVAAAGILSSVTRGDPLDIEIASDLLSAVARSDVEPLRIADDDTKARLRAYLGSGIALVLRQDDFSGEEKANLASSIARVGKPEDIADLVTLIHADIERARRGRAAWAAGDRGPFANGGIMSYAHWHLAAVSRLDAAGAEQVLISLLRVPEYLSDVAAAMARAFVPSVERSFSRVFRHDLMWAAREGATPSLGEDQRRARFAAELHAEVERLRGQNQDGKADGALRTLARALAAIDGRRSAPLVLDLIAVPRRWDEYVCLDAAELLLMAGAILPAAAAFALVDSVLERTEKWMQDSDRPLLVRILALCPFVDDPAAGIAKMRDVLSRRQLYAHELRELVTALGESRCAAATDLLDQLASDPLTLDQCEDDFVKALAALDMPRARELILAFVDPDIRGIALTRGRRNDDVLIAGITELARSRPEVVARLLELCERDLPEANRDVLSKVMDQLGTTESLAANLDLIDDARPSPVPQGVRDQLENAFVEQRPYAQYANTFTIHPRVSNELRTRLFKMAFEDPKRRKSAFMLLGQIESWRLEHGKPTGEPRHPELVSGQPWPPKKPDTE